MADIYTAEQLNNLSQEELIKLVLASQKEIQDKQDELVKLEQNSKSLWKK